MGEGKKNLINILNVGSFKYISIALSHRSVLDTISIGASTAKIVANFYLIFVIIVPISWHKVSTW